MHFRVAAVQDEGLPHSFTEARLWLEEWLNGSLKGAEFGSPGLCVMIVVFATESLPSDPPISRLSTNEGTAPTLALHVVIQPELVQSTPQSEFIGMLCSAIVRGLPAQPLRKPKGLEYESLRKALVASCQPFATSAV